jgi:hypothetical protein
MTDQKTARDFSGHSTATARWVALVCLFAGCAAQPTQVIVTIGAEPGVVAAGARLRLTVLGGVGRTEAPTASRFERVLSPGGADPAYPFELALAPLDGDQGRSYSVTARAETGAGGFVGQVRVIGGYVAGETLFVALTLEDACQGVVCGAQETCRAGACVDARSGEQGVGDAGPVADAGVRDAGDAEVRDVGPADGDGTCPAFIPGTWRVTSTEGSTRVGCATRATYDRRASVFEDLLGSCWSDRDAGGGDAGCNIYAVPPCSIERNTGDSRTTFTPVTGSLVTGFYGPFSSGCFFNLRAEYVGP